MIIILVEDFSLSIQLSVIKIQKKEVVIVNEYLIEVKKANLIKVRIETKKEKL